jgi:ketosteroid isomerase-like protein
MPANQTRQLVDQFIDTFNRVVRGEPVDALGWSEMLDENVNYMRQGVIPIVARCRNRAEARETLFPENPGRVIKLKPSFGIYPLEYIEEGNRIVVIAKGRGGNLLDIPYNNTYFFFLEVSDGKFVRVIEDLDASVTMRSICYTHLEEEPKAQA